MLSRLLLSPGRFVSRMGPIGMGICGSLFVMPLVNPGFKLPGLPSQSFLLHNDSKVSSRVDATKLGNFDFNDRGARRQMYRQLCYGSIYGAVAGIVIGKISSLLAYLGVISFLSIEWLHSRHIINKYSLFNAGFLLNTNILNLDNPFFKVSFLLTFFISAINI